MNTQKGGESNGSYELFLCREFGQTMIRKDNKHEKQRTYTKQALTFRMDQDRGLPPFDPAGDLCGTHQRICRADRGC